MVEPETYKNGIYRFSVRNICIMFSKISSNKPKYRYQNLEFFLQRAQNFQKNYNLGIDLQSLLKKLAVTISDIHLKGLLLDGGHGLLHAFDVLEMSLKLSEHNPDTNKNSIALAAMLHDICGIQTSIFTDIELFDRNLHPENGARLVEDLLPLLLTPLELSLVSIESICLAIRHHGYKTERFFDCLKGTSSLNRFVASYVRDADRIIEGRDFMRIIKVTENFGRPLLRSSILPFERLAFLLMDNRKILESEATDLLFFLSRNITISLLKSNYSTNEAQAMMDDSFAEKNCKKIVSTLVQYSYAHKGDLDGYQEIEFKSIINNILLNVRQLYKEFESRDLIAEATRIVLQFTEDKDNKYYQQNKQGLIHQLKELIVP